ncbi:MAG: hypothetical protein J7539_06085 [Niabella sp.]|nr:hypothetical protein [Niabella sp.]
MNKLIYGINVGRILLGLCCILSVQGCSKSGGSNSGNSGGAFLTCKINGQLHQFNSKVNANQKPVTTTVHAVVVGGWEGEDTGKAPGFGITLTIPGTTGVKEATYAVAGTTDLELDGQYYIQNIQNGQVVSTTSYSGGRTAGTNFTLTITSLTDWGVKGTFSGLLRNGDNFLTITEGSFSAPYNSAH